MTSAPIGAAWRAFFRLEINDARRSRWLAFVACVYTTLFALFVWLGLRESQVLGFTGLSRVVLNLTNAVVLAIPLVALVATSQSIVGARKSGFLELMLAQPVRRRDWFYAVLASRFVVVVGPLVALFAIALMADAASSSHDGALVAIVARSIAVTASLAWAFVGVGLWISAAASTAERATILALLGWLVATALHDFAIVGALLKLRLSPAVVFALAASNPAEASRIAILSGVDPDLSVLGPVGFWLANTLGGGRALLVGIAWPLVIGAVALWRAERRLSNSDLVA